VSDRLAYICATTLAAALTAGAPAPEAAAGDSGAAGADTEPDAVRVQREPAAARRAVIVDEREDASGAPRRRPAQIEIRDQRGDVGPSAWIGSIGRQLERFKRDGRPFAVLLVELRDSDRMRSDSRLEEVSRLADQLEHALASELRRSAARAGADGFDPRGEQASGSLTRERPGRYWLLSPDTDRIGARVLAERLADALRRLAGDRGASLDVAVGAAVCPEDGREAAALAAHADVELYAARTPAGRPPASVD
jgi:GGDEF domain-containing protein